MPKKNRKPFIDKASAVTFRLVHRSQRDPRIGQDDAQHVLAPVDGSSRSLNKDERRAEQSKYGIDFDDDYDYLQHLRDANEVNVYTTELESHRLVDRYRLTKDGACLDAGKDLPTTLPVDPDKVAGSLASLRIPSSVLETADMELKTHMLDRAAPSGLNLDLDPDVLAALDDDFDFDNPDNKLDDDFVVQAMQGGGGPSDEPLEEEGSSDGSMEEASEGDEWEEEETRTRFTEYSVTSSVMRRADGLQLLDARFEKFFEQYDPEEIGDLEEAAEAAEDHKSGLHGTIRPESERMRALADEFETEAQKDAKVYAITLAAGVEEEVVEKAREAGQKEEEEEPKEKVALELPGSKRQWDCESIVSFYSNLYNHPTLIAPPPPKKSKVAGGRIFVHPRTGLPLAAPPGSRSKGLKSALAELEGMETESAVTTKSRASTAPRPKDETPEQKRARKAAIKAERRERREERSANKAAFAEERGRLAKSAVNAARTQGLKMP